MPKTICKSWHRPFLVPSILVLPSMLQQQQLLLWNEEEEEESKQPAEPGLDDLFAPPTNFMFQGGFQGARAVAKDAKRWLLVNIQQDASFASHALNRDVWRNDLVENLVREGFIFFQTVRNKKRLWNDYCIHV